MLTLVINGEESWDSVKDEFIYTDTVTLELEHSLVSLSKWETLWEKPFLGKEEKTTEQVISYIKLMCLTPDVPDEVFDKLGQDHFDRINSYMNAKMSATWFTENGQKPGGRQNEVITSEVLYYLLFSAEIPVECENWHLSRLFTLLKVFQEKNATPKKMSKSEALAQRNKLNAERQAKLNTSG